jgi:hypothetical protein
MLVRPPGAGISPPSLRAAIGKLPTKCLTPSPPIICHRHGLNEFGKPRTQLSLFGRLAIDILTNYRIAAKGPYDYSKDGHRRRNFPSVLRKSPLGQEGRYAKLCDTITGSCESE